MRDYLKGHVVLTDKKGNVLVDQDNMILRAGRKEIINNGIGNFSHIYFGKNGNVVRENDIIDNIDPTNNSLGDRCYFDNDQSSNTSGNNTVTSLFYIASTDPRSRQGYIDASSGKYITEDTNEDESISYTEHGIKETNETDLVVSYTAMIRMDNNSSYFPLSTIGIGHSSTSTDETLFTRTVFATRYLEPGDEYTLTYKIYF